MQDYYLIRYQNSMILGPMNSSALITQLLSGEYTLEAEITGDLGPWVPLSQVAAMEDHYPKIKALLEDHQLYRNLPTKGLFSKIKKLFGL